MKLQRFALSIFSLFLIFSFLTPLSGFIVSAGEIEDSYPGDVLGDDVTSLNEYEVDDEGNYEYEINIEAGGSAVFRSSNCKSINRVLIKAADQDVKTNLTVGVVEEKDAKASVKDDDKAYEICRLSFDNEDNISFIEIQSKLTDEWLSENDLESGDISLYFANSSWQKLSTEEITQTQTTVFYETDKEEDLSGDYLLGKLADEGEEESFSDKINDFIDDNPWAIVICCSLLLLILAISAILYWLGGGEQSQARKR
jgi:PGF-pre-PGF domain-containing protein